MMQEAMRRQIYYILFDFKYQGQFCNFLILGIGYANCPLDLLLGFI